MEAGNFLFHYRCKDPEITHLSSADDSIAFLRGDRGTTQSFTRVLQDFRLCSGLQVNR